MAHGWEKSIFKNILNGFCSTNLWYIRIIKVSVERRSFVERNSNTKWKEWFIHYTPIAVWHISDLKLINKCWPYAIQRRKNLNICELWWMYRKISNIRRALVGNKIVDHSDVVGASPVGAAPTTSSFSTWHLASRDSAKTAASQYENLLSVGIWCVLY